MNSLYKFFFLYIWHFRVFTTDYVVWVLPFFEDCMVTYSCKFLCHLVSCGELSRLQLYDEFPNLNIAINSLFSGIISWEKTHVQMKRPKMIIHQTLCISGLFFIYFLHLNDKLVLSYQLVSHDYVNVSPVH